MNREKSSFIQSFLAVYQKTVSNSRPDEKVRQFVARPIINKASNKNEM